MGSLAVIFAIVITEKNDISSKKPENNLQLPECVAPLSHVCPLPVDRQDAWNCNAMGCLEKSYLSLAIERFTMSLNL